MKYSSSLVQKFITINDTPENIAQHLILKTAEIEHIDKRIIPETVVIGKVTNCEKHPDADKLSVCQIDCGKKGKYQILCGGVNVATGLLVPVALPWTHLEKIGITIEPRKMRWLDSNGMICSKEELGINEDIDTHEIRDLHKDFDDISDKDIGMPLKEKYARLEGRVMDVDSKNLTNRPDLTGHFGIATELHAIYDAKQTSFTSIKKWNDQFQTTHILDVLANSTKAKRKVFGETKALNTYILLEMNDVEIKASSLFTRLQMLDMWSQPRNNRVDFSNLFMLIAGQPVHFFDADKVSWNIFIRNAEKQEKFVDLFGAEHTLIETDMVIADEKKVLALAGIVGGMESGVTDSTKNILVEIANFDPIVVRKTWTRLWLRTDAELRYEKNINPLRSLYCLLLFLDEVKYYAKDLWAYTLWGLSYFVNWTLKIENWKMVDIDFKKMEQFIFWQEQKWFEKTAKDILEKLGFVSGTKGTSFTVPLRRSPDDINIAEDMYEEVARIYGYDDIPTLPFTAEIQPVLYTPLVDLTRKLEDILVRSLHANQTETYPRIWDKTVSLFGLDMKKLYWLQNPINPETPYLRDEMTYGLLNHVVKNHKFFDEFTLFDIGKVWKKNGKAAKWKFANEFVDEQYHIGIMLYQKDMSKREKDPILRGKNMVKVMLKDLWLLWKLSFEVRKNATYHPKKQAEIFYNAQPIGFIWSIHPLVLKAVKLPETAGIVNLYLSLDQLAEALKNEKEQMAQYETLQDQIIRRDLCFVVDTWSDFGPLLEAVKSLSEVSDLEVFDVYQWTNLPEGKKSVAFRIKLLWDWTMTTEQINDIMNKAIKAGEKAGGKLRG